MTVWTKIDNDETFAVAIYRYSSADPRHLTLDVGDLVQVVGRTGPDGAWYCGRLARGDPTRGDPTPGVFPASYVRHRDVVRLCDGSVCVTSGGAVGAEVCAALRQWGPAWRALYRHAPPAFRTVSVAVLTLLELRAQAAEGALPADSLRRLATAATHLLDRTAVALGFELPLRDDRPGGSLTGLAALHASTEARLSASAPPPPAASAAPRSRLLVTVEHAALRDPDAELVLWLQEAGGSGGGGGPLTEPYVVRAPPPAAHVLFVDLDGTEPTPDRFALVCLVVRPGPPRRLHGAACAVLGSAETEGARVSAPLVSADRDGVEGAVRRALGAALAGPHAAAAEWVSVSARRAGGEGGPGAGRARALALPAVLAPGDARNDLYVRLAAGAFSRTRASVQVGARLLDAAGRLLDAAGTVRLGAGPAGARPFTSLVTKHEERPRWAETMCCRLDAEGPAHLALTFAHVHGGECRTFAVAHLPVLHHDGSTVRDGEHTLYLYKVESKRGGGGVGGVSEDTWRVVLQSAWSRERGGAGGAPHKWVLPKDWVTVHTTLVSTRLTYREEVLRVLRLPAGAVGAVGAAGDPESVRAAVRGVLAAPPDDLVKFLADVLDNLMVVLTRAPQPDHTGTAGTTGTTGTHDDLMEDEEEECGEEEPLADVAFSAIVKVLGLLAEHKYNRYRALLDEYLERGFCHATAGERLLAAAGRTLAGPRRRRALRAAKCLHALARVAAVSRRLALALGAPPAAWERARTDFLAALAALMRRAAGGALPAQGAALRYLPPAAAALAAAPADRPVVAQHVAQALAALPAARLPTQRLLCLQELLRGELCAGGDRQARDTLAPLAAHTLATLIDTNLESGGCDKAARVLGEDRPRPGPDLLELCLSTVGVLVESLPDDERAGPARALLGPTLRAAADRPQLSRVAAALDVLAHVAPPAWRALPPGLADDALRLLRDTLARPPCPAHWARLLHALAAAGLRALRHAAAGPLPAAARRAWLRALVAVPPAPSPLSSPEAARLRDRHGDLAGAAAALLADAWLSWDEAGRAALAPECARAALDLALSAEGEARAPLPDVFADAMRAEYFSPESVAPPEGPDVPEGPGDGDERRLRRVREALTDRLDVAVGRGRGDAAWRGWWVSRVGGACAACPDAGLRSAALALVAAVGRQADALLEARGGAGGAALALMRALELYEGTGPARLVVRYVHRLAALQAAGGRPTEAGLALRRHAALLRRSRSPVPAGLRVPTEVWADNGGGGGCPLGRGVERARSQARLRSALELSAARLLRRGGEWELAAEVVAEAWREGGARSRAKMHGRLASLWRLAATAPRAPPTYYLVRHSGPDAPPALRHPAGWVVRAAPCLPLADFCARALDEWPGARLASHAPDAPHALHVLPLEPRPPPAPAPHPDLHYHHTYNNVSTFVYSRPAPPPPPPPEGATEDVESPEGEAGAGSAGSAAGVREVLSRWVERTEVVSCVPFPGVLSQCRVREVRSVLLCPLEVALGQLRDNADELRRLLRGRRRPLEPLTRRLLGTLDAAVQGGPERYERAFLSGTYADRHPEHAHLLDQLRAALAAQGPLLERALRRHESRAPPELRALHIHLEDKYRALQHHLSRAYPPPAPHAPHAAPPPPPPDSDSSSSDSLGSDTDGEAGAEGGEGGAGGDESAVSPRRTLLASLNQLTRHSVTSAPPAGGGGGAGAGGGTARRREKRRDLALSTGASQWYTAPATTAAPAHTNGEAGSPLRELRQHLLASRPLRAEVERAERERRASQRLSAGGGELLCVSAPPSCRTSIGTTDSTPSSEGDAPPAPPPLPHKTRHDHDATRHDADLTLRYSYDTVYSPRGSFLYTSLQRTRAAPAPAPAPAERAPTPPPKKKWLA